MGSSKSENLILRWDPGGAQKKWTKCPRLEKPILRWDLGGAKLITVLNLERREAVAIKQTKCELV